MSLVPNYVKTDPRSKLWSQNGRRGEYLVRFVLARPGQRVYFDNIDMDEFANGGDSMLTMDPSIASAQMKVGAGKGQIFTIGSNEHGRVSHIDIVLVARNLTDAERRAHDLGLPLISYWSVAKDVGIDIAGSVVTEVSTDARAIKLGVVGVEQPLSLGNVVVADDLRDMFAAYRQGQASTNPFFAFLSFWRVLEGVKHRRGARSTKAQAAGEPIREPEEFIPTEKAFYDGLMSDEIEVFWPFRGRSFNHVLEQLSPTLRNAIAHIDPEQPVMSADRFDDTSVAERGLMLLRYMARVRLQAEVAVSPANITRIE